MTRLPLLTALVALLLATTAEAGEWVAGDLHVHTTYSHDSYGGPGDDNTGPEDFYTAGHSVTSDFAMAASRGLDYLAITDHNDVRSQSDPGFGAGGVIGVPGYENSLKGHAQMLGAKEVYPKSDSSLATVTAMTERLRSEGGVFQANHPCDPVFGYDEIEPDTMEIWNLPWVYQPPFPSAADNDCALGMWYERLDRGETVTAVGGSDSHWLSTTSLQGAGQPTTWVYVDERSVKGIFEGLRAGRTFISHQPPAYGGPKVFLEADADTDGSYESMQGDTVPPGTAVRVRVDGAPSGSYVRLVTDGGQGSIPAVVTGPSYELRVPMESGVTWVQAQVYGEDVRSLRPGLCGMVMGADLTEQTTYCANSIAMLAQTSALFLRNTPAP